MYLKAESECSANCTYVCRVHLCLKTLHLIFFSRHLPTLTVPPCGFSTNNVDLWESSHFSVSSGVPSDHTGMQKKKGKYYFSAWFILSKEHLPEFINLSKCIASSLQTSSIAEVIDIPLSGMKLLYYLELLQEYHLCGGKWDNIGCGGGLEHLVQIPRTTCIAPEMCLESSCGWICERVVLYFLVIK